MIITYKNKDKVTERYYKNYYEYLHFSAEENKRLDEINQNFVFMQTYLRDRILQIFSKSFRRRIFHIYVNFE